MKSYSTVLSSASAEIVIEKSRFIGHSFHVEDIEETENIIRDVKKKYYDATHNCFAYIMGEETMMENHLQLPERLCLRL